LNARGMHGTFFVNSGFIENPSYDDYYRVRR
jgi:hypothetical protein